MKERKKERIKRKNKIIKMGVNGQAKGLFNYPLQFFLLFFFFSSFLFFVCSFSFLFFSFFALIFWTESNCSIHIDT